MKGLKIIPMFLLLIALTYTGMLFVQANGDEMVVKLGSYQTPPIAIGFIILSSVFVGMIICGVLCSVEMLGLYVQNRRLKKKLLGINLSNKVVSTSPPVQDVTSTKASGRFT